MVPISYKRILWYIIIRPEAESIIKLSTSSSIQTNLLAGCASDRSVLLYDMRGSAPLRKVILKMKSNALAWNPMEAFVFTVANEDYKYNIIIFFIQILCINNTNYIMILYLLKRNCSGWFRNI